MAVSTLDIEKLRQDTPGCRHVLHFNNAGAALMPRPVSEAVIGHLKLESEIGGYEAARQQANRVEHVYHATSRLIGAGPDEIAIVQNASQAWASAFYALPFKPGDRILTSVSEYASNYIAFLQVARKTGAIVEPVPNDKTGRLSVDALENMLDERVKLIAITHVPTNGGLINPAEEVGKIARDNRILYLLDACQSAGQMPIDVTQIGCDMLSATSRKYLRGPRGMGFLYVRRDLIETLEPPILDLHAATWTGNKTYQIRPDARRFETWETNYAAKIGFGVAVDYTLEIGMETIWQRIQILACRLRAALAEIPQITLQDLGTKKCGIVSFTMDGQLPEQIVRNLGEQKINVSYSVLESTRLDMENRSLNDGVVRASVHYYNTEDEIERFSEVLKSLA